MHSTIRRAVGAMILVAGTIFTVAACEDMGPRTGQMTMYLTDAPGDVQKAVVTIEEIYLTGGDGDEGRVVLRDIPFTTDLLTLADSLHLLIEDAEIPADTYGQLRMVISGAYIEVEAADGGSEIYASSPTYAGLPEGAVVTGSLQMPSFASSGLKVNLPGDAVTVIADSVVILVVDFDVSQSFGKLAGDSGQWVMTPVIHGTVPPAAP
jgi:hypothetical protein